MARSQRTPSSRKPDGLFAPPARLRDSKDPRRRFPRSVLAELFHRHGYSCRNPFCEFDHLPLEAHHIYAHSLGGRSVAQNALMLCRDCHSLVHRGAVPLAVALAWKRGDWQSRPERRAEDVIAGIRSIPLSVDVMGHERLTSLNQLLIAAHALRSKVSRDAAIAEAMLAKTAVLYDAYPDRGAAVDSSRRAFDTRYLRALPFASAARFFGDRTRSGAVQVRALHFRAIAQETIGDLHGSLQALKQAWSVASQAVPDGNPSTFHPLSPPGRILQLIGRTRARLGGSPTVARREFMAGLELVERFGGWAEWNDGRLREVSLELTLRNPNVGEKKLACILRDLPSLGASGEVAVAKLQADLYLTQGDIYRAHEVLVQAELQATAHRLYGQQHQIRRRRR